MKKLVLLIAVLCSSFTFQDGPLVELLKLDNLYDPADSLVDVVAKTEKHWVQVRQGVGNKEVTDLTDSPEQQLYRDRVIAIAKELGLFDARKPEPGYYDYAAIPGAFLDGFRLRVSNLIEAWKEGIRFHKVVIFTGDRKLRKEKEDSLDKLPQGWKVTPSTAYETEYDMCKLVWDQTVFPEDMQVELEFVNAPCPEGAIRPSTKDCYKLWQQEPGSLVIFSHPIYWAYQELAAQNSLESFTIHIYAQEASDAMLKRYEDRIVSIIQDVVAKTLHELLIAQEKASCYRKDMKFTITSYPPEAVTAIRPMLDTWAIEMYREYPYLYVYQGETDYNSMFEQDPNAMVLFAEQDGQKIGVLQANPLDSPYLKEEVYTPSDCLDEMRSKGYNPEDIYYISCFLLKKEFRQDRILALNLFAKACEVAKQHGKKAIAFMEIADEPAHPLKPDPYVPCEPWKLLGVPFTPMDVAVKATWPTLQPDGSVKDEEHTMLMYIVYV